MSGHHTDLPLFAWQPPCMIIAFPLEHRVGKVRDVARKLLAKTTERHADYYASQIEDALRHHLSKAGVSQIEQDRQICAFWGKVNAEIARLTHRGTGSNDPRGAA